MPIRENREYREMPLLTLPGEGSQPRLASDYYVEGYATTFEDPYILLDDGTSKFYEVIDRNAFSGADMSDVVFLRDHTGKCFARTRMKQGKDPTLILEPDDHGLFVAADLGITAEGREEWHAITAGLIYQMSFAFTVAEDDITMINDTDYMRRILSFRKVYDVSSVALPANPGTVIDAATRTAFDGFIAKRQLELADIERRRKQRQRIRIMLEANR